MSTEGQAWRSLEFAGFPDYEINRQAEIRRVGTTEIRATNAEGALGLVDATGQKCFRSAGKLCREAFGPKAPGATTPRTKLTAEQVAEILRSPKSAVELAADLDVSHSTIKAVRARQTWRGVKAKPRARYKTDSSALRAA